mmetsp:Transcript_7929/g.27841  ORF Transcript_7929/g.27841 Transcript_7929/m.27841 type:complete len:481 (-) Transcript_7929:264-1706(-)
MAYLAHAAPWARRLLLRGLASAAGTAPAAAAACAPPPITVLKSSDHELTDDCLPLGAWDVLSRLNSNGHEAYVVGGAVRDLLMGRAPKDFDVVTCANPKRVRRLFGERSVLIKNRKGFSIVNVNYRAHTFEVSSFESKSNAAGNLLPAAAIPAMADGSEPTARLKQLYGDAVTRDFKVNSLYWDPFTGEVMDFLGGVEAMRRRELGIVGGAQASFAEDPARTLRAVRLSAKTGLTIEESMDAVLMASTHVVESISPGRVSMELDKMFCSGNAAQCVALLHRYSFLGICLDALAEASDNEVSQLCALLGAWDRERELWEQAGEHRHTARQADPGTAMWPALLLAVRAANRPSRALERGYVGWQAARGRGWHWILAVDNAKGPLAKMKNAPMQSRMSRAKTALKDAQVMVELGKLPTDRKLRVEDCERVVSVLADVLFVTPLNPGIRTSPIARRKAYNAESRKAYNAVWRKVERREEGGGAE